MRIAINGFGRMGRLFLRATWQRPDVDIVSINDPGAGPETFAVLLEHDSVQGRFDQSCTATDDALLVGGRKIPLLRSAHPPTAAWDAAGVDLVVECSGRYRTTATLAPHVSAASGRRVLVSCAVKDTRANVVVGVNHDAFDLTTETIVTAASCTTNCLAPVVCVLHDGLGIERGTATTLHAPTATQRVVDAAHSDPRRARASSLSLVPTSSNSGYAVALIVPELAGRLDSMAVRVSTLTASLTDCVFHVARDTTADEVNDLLRAASESPRLAGILGFETRPLVGADFSRDPRSGIVDALSTRVTDRRLVKVLAWYDNEWGYANRMADLVGLMTPAQRG